ncbi:MAG: 23S rRNA (pseudouridine(1915)-N(3))-methyltransferase RlmH [Verrucomicrobia bacterium]|nr:23S rRNA (pseudouridine(1915)-N(3))-methyltransferase RlmH [Verrucomicrobiota bacterium]
MIKIKFLSVGKTHEKWLEEGIDMYVKRMSPWAQFEFIWLKDASQLEKALSAEKHVVILDPKGQQVDSHRFADWFFKKVEQAGSRLTFAIGPAEGFSEKVKAEYEAISFSQLTFTHQLARLILIEQLFRAFEIKKGSAYHK